MNTRQMLERRAAITSELQAIHAAHADAALPAEKESRWTELRASLTALDGAMERQAVLDEQDRNTSEVRSVETRGDVEPVFAFPPEVRMADHLQRTTGLVANPGLSIGKTLRGYITGKWDGAEAEKRVMAEGIGTTGGFLVPDILSANIIDLMRNQSILIRAGARTIAMPTPSMTTVSVESDPTAYWRGEGQIIPESDGSFAALNLQAHSLAALVRVNNELLADAPGFTNILDTQLSQVLALKLDAAGLTGLGVGMPLGLRGWTGIAQVSMGANGALLTSYDAFLTLLQAIEEANSTADTLIVSPRTKYRLATIPTGLTGDLTKLQPPAAFAGLRVLSSNQVSVTETQGLSNVASTAYLGDFSQMAIAVRQNVTIEISREADDTFKRNQSLIRAILRADIAVFRPGSFARLIGIL